MSNLPSRADDERALRVLSLRMAGADLAACTRAVSSNVASVSKIVSRARLADIQECGFWGDEPKDVAAYWRPTLMRGKRAIMAGDKPGR